MEDRNYWLMYFAQRLNYISAENSAFLKALSLPFDQYACDQKILTPEQINNLRFLYAKYLILLGIQNLGYLSPQECQNILRENVADLREGRGVVAWNHWSPEITPTFLNSSIEHYYQQNVFTKEDYEVVRLLFPSQSNVLENYSGNAASGAMETQFLETSDQLNDMTEQKKEKEENFNFGHYEVLEEIGQGGMGKVYKAYDPKLNRTVAIKVILTSAEVSEKQIKRFMIEARSMAQLEHPNIIKVYEIGEEPQNYFIMEYIEGDILSSRARSGKVSPKEAAQIILKAALALEEVHKNGILHRDIKPSNIMIDQRGEPRLMDFGLAKVENSDLSRTGEVMGTPAYMSPEQAEGKKVDARSDVYSLGATLYEVLTKTSPFQGDNVFNIIHQVVTRDPIAPCDLNPDIPPELEAICLKSLEKSPGKRYLKAKFFARDLDNFLQERPILAKPPTRWTYFQKLISRNKTLAVISLFFFLILNISVTGTIYLQYTANQKLGRVNLEFKQKNDDFVRVNEELNQANEDFIKINQQLKEEKENAIGAKNIADQSVYQANITLAQKFSEEEASAEVDHLLERCLPQHRGWEWHWLRSVSHDEFLTLKGHSHKVSHSAFSPDAKYLISVGGNWDTTKAVLWDLSTKPRIEKIFTSVIEEEVLLSTCSFSPDGETLAFGGRRHFSLWSLPEQKYIVRATHRHFLEGLAFHPKEDKIATSFRNVIAPRNRKAGLEEQAEDEFLIFRNTKTGEKEESVRRFLSMHHCAYNSNGKLLATSVNEKLFLWQTGLLSVWKVLSGHKAKITSCAFRPGDDKTIATTSHDKTIILWNSVNGKVREILRGHSREVTDCVFTPDGNKLISVGNDNRIILWNVETGKIERKFFGSTGRINQDENDNAIECVTLSPDGRTIVTGHHDSDKNNLASLKFWQVDRKENPYVLSKGTSPVTQLKFSPDGKKLAIMRYITNSVELWDLVNNKALNPIRNGLIPTNRDCAFSPDGKYLFIVSTEKNASLYEVATQKLVAEFFSPLDRTILRCDYSPDGKKVAAILDTDPDTKDSLLIWEIPENLTPENVQQVLSPSVQIYQNEGEKCVFSSDSTQVAVTASGRVALCDIANKTSQNILLYQPIPGALRGRNESVFRGCSFSPDNKFIAISGANGLIYLFDREKAKVSKLFFRHADSAPECFFTPDSKRIISCGMDRTIKIWDVQAQAEDIITIASEEIGLVKSALLTLQKHDYGVRSLALSADGKILASGGEDGTVKIWRIDYQDRKIIYAEQ